MVRTQGWLLIGLLAAGLVVGGGCKPKPKDYRQSMSSDARRAEDSMPAPTGGGN